MNTDIQKNAPSKRRPGYYLINIAPLKGSPPFRLLFAARTASLLVYGVMGVAVSWQVFTMTDSSLHVGLVGFSSACGMTFGLLFGGALADSHDRRRLMLWTRSGFLGVALLLLVNASLSSPSLLAIYIAAALGGIAGGISAPALMAAAPSLIAREHLAAAGALAAIAAQTGAIIGPTVAGLLISGPGLVFCYAIVALGAATTPVVLWFLPPLVPQGERPEKGMGTIMEGWRFLCSSRIVAGLLLIDLAALLFAVPYVLMPQIGTQMSGGGPSTVGLLYTAPAVGAFLAALSSGWTNHTQRPGFILVVMVVIWGAAIALAGVSVKLPVVLGFFAVSGFSGTIAEILRGALLQHHTPDHLRGRISGLWLMQATVGPALGGIQMGTMARLFSPAVALACGGVACMITAVCVSAAIPGLRKAKLTTIAKGRDI